ncbi:MAG TPA: zinc ABC transporter substrate-binding protein [Pirellulaceae bacterium]|nr:zinc ABC transporter substrate-binding protein [Pirellulaceae bacterium]
MRNSIIGSILGLAICVSSAVADEPAPKKLVIVCSTTQVTDFVRQVVGDRCEVHGILGPGVDPHLYRTRPQDPKLVATADICFDNGLHLEGKDWMRNLAESAGKPIVSCATGIEPLKLESDGQPYTDPHAWFSPKNASIYVRNILKEVSQRDPDHKAEYEARAKLYLDQLRVLNAWIVEQVNVIPPQKRVLVTSHDAFQYFCQAYGFKSQAPTGWSTDQEIGGGATGERIRKTAQAIRDQGIKAIFIETSVNPKMIEEIAIEAGIKVGGKLYSDSMGAPGTGGETYLGMMRENVLTIVEAMK